MLLRKASQLHISDIIDLGALGRWCVENASTGDHPKFIDLILSNRQPLTQADLTAAAEVPVAPAVELRRLTVRRKDYLNVVVALRAFSE